jgi:thiamine-phosphate pyrophosphorylase
MINLNYLENYFFTHYLNNIIKKNLRKFKNVSIVYDTQENSFNLNEFLKIKEFCKKEKIKIYFLDNIKLAIKLRVDGLFITSQNKRIYQPYKKSFKFIGAAHNQREFYFKIYQKCEYLFLSPIFYNSKYSNNEILKTTRFNLITLNWKKKLIALGGINSKNLKKIYLTRSCGVGFVSWISKSLIKKPVHFKNVRALNNL